MKVSITYAPDLRQVEVEDAFAYPEVDGDLQVVRYSEEGDFIRIDEVPPGEWVAYAVTAEDG